METGAEQMPTASYVREMLADQGLDLSEARLAAALVSHQSARQQLDRLRAITQSFLEPVVEPASALRWLQAGGVSR